MTPRASAQILPLDSSVEHLLGLLEVGSERWAEGTLRGTDLEDPKEVEEDAKPLNALCKRLSEDAVSRKVRPLPGRWAAVPRPSRGHSQTHVHASIQADGQRWARTLHRAAPGQQPCEAGTACHSPGQQRAGQGLRPPLRPDPRAKGRLRCGRERGRVSGGLTMTQVAPNRTALSAGEPLKSWGQCGRGREAGLCPAALAEPGWGSWPPAALTGGTRPAELPLATLPGQRAGTAPQGAPVQHRVGPAQALLPGGLLRALHQGRREGALLPDGVQHPAALQPADAAPAGGDARPTRPAGGALPRTGPFLLEPGRRSAPKCRSQPLPTRAPSPGRRRQGQGPSGRPPPPLLGGRGEPLPEPQPRDRALLPCVLVPGRSCFRSATLSTS